MRIQLLLLITLLCGCAIQPSKQRANEEQYTRCSSLEACVTSIRETITLNWKRSKDAKNGMSTGIVVELNSKGELVNIQITEKSSSPAYDLYAKQAIERAEPFSQLQGLSLDDFNKHFRKFTFVFRAEDLRD